MAKIITVNRKYLAITLSLVILALVGFAGITLWETVQAVSSKTEVVPEVKMLEIAIEPQPITQDVTYGEMTFKDAKVIPATTFDLYATVQNTTSQKMTNIPVELTVCLAENETQKITTMGTIPALDPGGSARISFKQIKALGDARGSDPASGQHLITLRIKPNAEGGVTQTSEATLKFIIDSSLSST